MDPSLRVHTVVHRAAIAGKVVDGLDAERVVPGVAVAITASPAAFPKARGGRTFTAIDGGFCFADLPDGAYSLSFTLPGGKSRYGVAQHDFTVARDAAGAIAITVQLVALPPTGLRGLVQGRVQGVPAPLSLACVRVGGSGEITYTDEGGHFYLTGVEVGSRGIAISAAGFQTTTVHADILEGQIGDAGTVVLDPPQ